MFWFQRDWKAPEDQLSWQSNPNLPEQFICLRCSSLQPYFPRKAQKQMYFNLDFLTHKNLYFNVHTHISQAHHGAIPADTPCAQEAATAPALPEKCRGSSHCKGLNGNRRVFSATYNSADLWWLNANSGRCLHNDTLQYSKYCMLLCS